MNIGNITNVHDSYISQGWLCPRCKRVNAPWMPCCICDPPKIKYTTNTSTLVFPGQSPTYALDYLDTLVDIK
jgi:hypothetical protein